MRRSDLRRERFAVKRHLPSRTLLAQIKERMLGHVGQLAVWLVHEDVVVAYVDPDFTCGGNHARYAYVPTNEVWVTARSPRRAAGVIAHEAIECLLMLNGLTYASAHREASLWEVALTRRVLEGEERVTTWREAVDLSAQVVDVATGQRGYSLS